MLTRFSEKICNPMCYLYHRTANKASHHYQQKWSKYFCGFSCFEQLSYSIKASVHDGTYVLATWNWNQKLSIIGQIKANI